MYLRILSHGKVADLSHGFALKDGKPFSICLIKKTVSMETNALVKCKCVGDSESSDLPVVIGDWTPALIASLAPNAVNMSNYDVYYGASENVNS